MKLQPTKEYLLLIDMAGVIQESEIGFCPELNELFTCKENCSEEDYYISTDGKLYHTNTDPFMCFKVIAYYPLTPEAKELDLPLLPDSFKYEDFSELDKVVQEEKEYWYEKTGSLTSGEIVARSASLGYKAAQSKQFSLEDMEAAYQKGFDDCISGKHLLQTYKESLSTKHYPREFIPQYETFIDVSKMSHEGQDCVTGITRELESYRIKTTTNESGKQVLVGGYLW